MDTQEYVDALREGNYFKALELANFINQKYEQIKQPIGADELVQLGGYELSRTEINANDISAVNFLYNYIQYHNQLANGELGYRLITFLSLISIVLSIKRDKDFRSTVDLVSITNLIQFQDFFSDNSDFSKLVERNMSDSEWMKKMIEPLNEEKLLEKIAVMDDLVFANFHRSVQQMQEKLKVDQIHFFCPLVHSVAQAKSLKETVKAFRLRLQNKLRQEGIEVTNYEEIIFPEEPTIRQKKIIKRYNAINVLYQELQDKIVLESADRDMIVGIIEICTSNKADWYDRHFSQKFTDVLSGMKNIFCQKNNNYNDKSVRCVELKDAARRTCGRTGQNAENTGGQIFYYQWQK